MSDAASVPEAAPPSLLRPYSRATDASYIPILLRTAVLENVKLADVAFLIHPAVVSIIIGASGVALFYLNRLFFSVLVTKQEEIALERSQSLWGWQDSAAMVIYSLPPIAAVIGLLFALAHWYHTKLFTRIADAREREIDVVDISAYYSKSTSSAFWCLEFQNEIAVCLGIDGRCPAKILRTVSEEEMPKPAEVDEKAAVLADEEDTEQDLALFRDSAQMPAPPVDDGYVPLSDEVLGSAAPGPLLRKPSNIEASSACQIRHMTIGPSFRKTAQVDSYILDLAVHSALGTSAKAPTRFSQVVLVLDPKLDKAMRAQALNRGFRIAGRVGLEESIQDSQSKPVGRLEGLLRSVWPVSFEQEVLLLNRRDWEKQKVRSM